MDEKNLFYKKILPPLKYSVAGTKIPACSIGLLSQTTGHFDIGH